MATFRALAPRSLVTLGVVEPRISGGWRWANLRVRAPCRLDASMGTPWVLLRSLADQAAAVAGLPASGALPVRTVLVPTERHAHALRRALVKSGRSAALAGTRFVGPLTLAREVLAEAGRDFTPGEESLRAARLLALFEKDVPLEYFDLALLRDTRGWPEAFASAIGDLESAGLSPDRLPTTSKPWRDVALLWREVDSAAGHSFTGARVFLEAAATLQKGAGVASGLVTGPVLVTVTGRETAAEARFLGALPGGTFALATARPLRPRSLTLVEALFGKEALAALESAPLPGAVATERDLLARYLFAPPEVLADPARPRSLGPDGTVILEEYAGVETEVEAAAEWVAREVLTRRTPLEDVAVLVPNHHPLVPLVASRIARLPWPGGEFPVQVAGGLPVVATAAGARVLALVRALGAFLPAESMGELYSSLNVKIGDRDHLTFGEAMGVAWSVGTTGGSAARPEGALDWTPRAAARQAQLEKMVNALDEEGEKREGWKIRPQLDALRAARPAIDALVSLTRLVVEDRPLAEIAPALAAFLETWMRLPGKGAAVRTMLAESLEGAKADAVASSVRGAAAMAFVEERLGSLRLSTLRFGEPAVYVGTVAAAAGLEFQAVRILGLCEGALPSTAREDAVLPDQMRQEAGPLVPLSGDRVLAQLHAFDRAVQGAASRIALSVPHGDAERSDREISSLLVEVGAALGRPDPKRTEAIPDLASLERTSFGPARVDAAAFRDANPVSAAQWLDRAATTSEIPPAWKGAPSLDIPGILALRNRIDLGPADGILGDDGPFPAFAGLDPEHPISASALERLLSCPLRFLRERVLGWNEPGGAPSVREIDPLHFGSMFHEAAERFYAEHGEEFVSGKRSLAHWKKVLKEFADQSFDALCGSYPLVGQGVLDKERARLLRDLEAFLEYDAKLPLARFVAVERAFDGVALDAGGTSLHVRGYIDRLDVEEDHALVRDLKTGRDHPRIGDEADPTPVRDVQLGLYGLVARKLAGKWDIPRKVQAAYVYARGPSERDFRKDHAALEAAAKGWLAVAAGLLFEQAFPPTSRDEDCAFCPFAPVCGAPVQGRAAAQVDEAQGALAAFFETRKKKGKE